MPTQLRSHIPSHNPAKAGALILPAKHHAMDNSHTHLENGENTTASWDAMCEGWVLSRQDDHGGTLPTYLTCTHLPSTGSTAAWAPMRCWVEEVWSSRWTICVCMAATVCLWRGVTCTMSGEHEGL